MRPFGQEQIHTDLAQNRQCHTNVEIVLSHGPPTVVSEPWPELAMWWELLERSLVPKKDVSSWCANDRRLREPQTGASVFLCSRGEWWIILGAEQR